jgi:phage terminase large subunit-like protein
MAKIGNQIPTLAVVLPYTESLGGEAVALYNMTENTLQEWQELLINDIMATTDGGLWTHTKFGYAVSRRNGKTEVVTDRELWGLFNGEHILHTAHLTDTAHIAWERLKNRIESLGVVPKSTYKAYGKERIELNNGGVIDFRTRTSSGALGSGYDLLVIDEAQEYTRAQQTALNYVTSSSKNPQTIMCGTPPTAVSAGEVFRDYRDKTIQGESINCGWAEWSVDHMTDVKNKDAWYQTNPSLGTILTERIIQDENNGDDIDFNIQRLGLWLKYNQQSAISAPEWDALKVETLPKLKAPLYAGVKFGRDGQNVVLAMAAKTTDDKIFVEAIDCRNQREGNEWLVNFLLKCNIAEVIADGASGLESFLDACKEQKIKGVRKATVSDVIQASSDFETAVTNKTLCHNGQPALRQSATNCQHRAIGSAGGYGYKTLDDDIEVALVEAVILAAHAAAQAKEIKQRQRVSY